MFKKNYLHRKKQEYITQAKEQVKRALMFKSVRQDYWEHLLLQAEGRCGDCGSSSLVAVEEESDNQIRYRFSCGHSLLKVYLEEKIKVTEAISVASLGESDEKQAVSARIYNVKSNKENEEILAAKRYSDFNNLSLENFSNDVENSPVDVIGESKNTKEYFQVTKLYNKNFWSELFSNKMVDISICTDMIVNLVEGAIKRKINFDPKEKEKIILLIDSWPGILPKYIDKSRKDLISIIEGSGFKEVYIVGSTKDNSYSLMF